MKVCTSDWWDDSASKGAYHQAGHPEIYPQGPHGQRRKRVASPMLSSSLWDVSHGMHAQTHTDKNNYQIPRKNVHREIGFLIQRNPMLAFLITLVKSFPVDSFDKCKHILNSLHGVKLLKSHRYYPSNIYLIICIWIYILTEILKAQNGSEIEHKAKYFSIL